MFVTAIKLTATWLRFPVTRALRQRSLLIDALVTFILGEAIRSGNGLQRRDRLEKHVFCDSID